MQLLWKVWKCYRRNFPGSNVPLTLRSQRPVQSCVCGSLVTESRNRTRWGRRSAPGRRTPSRHSSWRRSSGCRCSVEKQRMNKQNKDKSSRFGFFIRSVVHLSAGKHKPDVTLRHRPTLIDTSSSSLCIHSSRSTEWNATWTRHVSYAGSSIKLLFYGRTRAQVQPKPQSAGEVTGQPLYAAISIYLTEPD